MSDLEGMLGTKNTHTVTAFGKPLTEEEDMIMRLLARGKMAKEIALFLECSASHVEQRLRYVRGKLNASTTYQAMYIWARSSAAHNTHDLDAKIDKKGKK